MPTSWSLWHICCQLLVSVCWPVSQSSYIFNTAQCVPSLWASVFCGWAGRGEFGWIIAFPSKDWGLMEKMICCPPQCAPKWHVVSLILISQMLDNSHCLSSPIQTLWDCQFSRALFEQFTEELEGIRWSKNTVKFPPPSKKKNNTGRLLLSFTVLRNNPIHRKIVSEYWRDVNSDPH